MPRTSQPEVEPVQEQRSVWPRLRRRSKTSPMEHAMADKSLDDALIKLADATRDNDAAAVRVRQNNSSIRARGPGSGVKL